MQLVRRDPPPPPAGRCQRRDFRQMAQACAASGASQSLRDEHVLPLVRRDTSPPPTTAGGGICARRHKRVPQPARRDRCETSTSPCRSCDVTPHRLATAGGGLCARRHKRVPHLTRRDRCETSTSSCRSCDATAPLPLATVTASGWMSRQAAHACAASGASRPLRDEHVPIPLVRRDSPSPPPTPLATAGGGMCALRDKRMPYPAGRDRRRETSTSPCRSCDGDARTDAV